MAIIIRHLYNKEGALFQVERLVGSFARAARSFASASSPCVVHASSPARCTALGDAAAGRLPCATGPTGGAEGTSGPGDAAPGVDVKVTGITTVAARPSGGAKDALWMRRATHETTSPESEPDGLHWADCTSPFGPMFAEQRSMPASSGFVARPRL